MINKILDYPPENYETLQKHLDILAAPSDSLAAVVVCYKTLGLDRDGALICMSELSRRRGLGEEFDFEKFIETEIQKIPKFVPLDLVKISEGLAVNVKSFTNFLK